MKIEIPEHLRSQHLRARLAIDSLLNSFKIKDKKLVWKYGEYKGREAEVKTYYWDEADYSIWVLVRTIRKSGEGYLDSGDYIHRRYYRLSSFEIKG